MKNLQYWFLVLIMVILVIGCGSPPLALPESTGQEEANTPNSPLATPKPEATATKVGYPIPEVISIPPQNVTTVDSLASGLKIVYAETDGKAGESKIWMSNTDQLDKRVLLAKIGPHKPYYGLGGQVSPDGTKLDYVVVPPDASSKSIVEIGYELWILDIATQVSNKIPEAVNGFVKWTPDSKSIVYSRNKYDEMGGVDTKVYLMPLDDWQEKLVFSTNSYFTPLEFLDNQRLLYLEIKSEKSAEVRSLDLTSGQTQLLREVDVPQHWESYHLSPDKNTMLIVRVDTNSSEKKYELIAVSLVTGEKQTLLTYPYHQDVDRHPIYRPDVRWLPNSQDFVVHSPPQTDWVSHLDLMSVNTKVSPQPFLDNASFLKKPPEYSDLETFLMMGEWSPDGKWLTLLQYPKPGQLVYLLEVATKKMTLIPLEDPSHSVSVMGWVQ